MKRPDLQSSSIVWFYYNEIIKASHFYGELLGLELILDEGWARIYKISSSSFVGLVDSSSGRGHCEVAPESAVLLTLDVDNIEQWYSFLKDASVQIEGKINTMEDIEVQCFFLRDPGGYALEIQKFMNPQTSRKFHLPDRTA
jgi:hypothetical protein